MRHWFFPQRLGRLAWFLRIFALLVLPLAILVILSPKGPLGLKMDRTVGEIISGTLVLVLIVYTFLFVHLPRCRSLGLPAIALVAMFVPPLNALLGLMFLLGSEGYWERLRRRPLQNTAP